MIVAMVANMGGLNEQERDIQATRIAIATTSPRLVPRSRRHRPDA
jgi:hypothetical protein